MKRKLPPEEIKQLLNNFNENVAPWCKENHLSLHEAFEICRDQYPDRYNVLSALWHTEVGKTYLQSVFRTNGGRL